MTKMQTEQLLNATTITINCSTPERLQEIVNYLINCPDPENFSHPGQHAHFFIVDTQANAIRVSKWSAPACIKHYLRTAPLTPAQAIPNLNPRGIPSED